MIIIVFLLLFKNGWACLQLSDSENERMPPLVRLDPYEECVQKSLTAYCMANFTLASDTVSPLLKSINEYSECAISRYNHANLRYGICLNNIHGDSTDVDLKHSLEVHLNESLWKSHQLKVRITDDYFCDINNKARKKDNGDIVMAIIFITIIIANLVGSLCDYYKVECKGKGLLLLFSVVHNWKRLVGPTSENPRFKPLRSIHGAKGVMASLVVLSHSILPCYEFINNPKVIEQLHNDVGYQYTLLGPILMQIFFIISGFLLVYNCLVYEEKRELTWNSVPWLLLLRWLRVAPVHALMLGFVSTLNRHISSGPGWQKIIIKEAEDCQRTWWQHLVYINNYTDNSKCMIQSWYLATDTQLYCIGVFLYMICKNPRVRRMVLPLTVLAGIVVSGLETYYEDLDGVLIITPELAYREFRDSVGFKSYTRPISNFSGYTTGLILGYLMYYWLKIGVKGEHYYKYRHLNRALFICDVFIHFSGVIFYNDGPRQPLYLRVLFGSLWKPLFSLIAATVMAGGMLKIEGIYTAILEWQGWVYLSRLSYSVYLVHIPYLRIVAGATTELIDVSWWILIKTMGVTLVNSYALALVFWILVEAPVENLMRMLLGRVPKEADNSSTEVKDQPCERYDSTQKNK